MAPSRPKLDRIKVPNRYDVLADVLREKIFSGEYANGTVLPGERELVEQTGLSRGSVREALRVLEAEGLVQTRPGRYGGTIVHQGAERAIGRLVDLFIKGRRIKFETLLQTRQAIEPTLAELAALNRTETDLSTLQEATLALEQAHTDAEGDMASLNVSWHLAVAAASHNELLTAFMNSIASACLRASALEDYGSDELRKDLIRAHRRIFEAIEAQDAAAAHRRMARHLNAYSGELGEVAPREIELE
ncbi:FadR/GntR family transcriptional regulator [Amorphus sp. 3PC139-8]|uniref:FadR/GntR family transcriptional regulator n=1 Tax=Amorphus sp. 3PC139-8 TaxID=2735676 RepID=UPI00345D7430